MKVCFSIHGNLGDQLCLISAARYFARSHRDLRVAVDTGLPEILDAFGDDLLVSGKSDGPLDVIGRHRVKHASPDWNYVGTFLHAMGEKYFFPRPELPEYPLGNEAYAVVQPCSRYAPNPHAVSEFVQSLVNEVRDHLNVKVYAVGDKTTLRGLEGVDYSQTANNVAQFLSMIRGARFALVPRSAGAHAAAAYHIPSFVWLPDDGENWHLDYPEWRHERVLHRLGRSIAILRLRRYLISGHP